ncbi:hypothetical protein [Bradyrhizobium sp. LHD-71]|uniref:hypothetical protein n=1 Tax=Bradyrhizobium sp. LHD-71 TaxID=3072141 RepID=UPI00280C7BC2|nr:hypothetical protein [Bradyrhizobium sp. LHD-71]MDQ8730699.1 hypothetical protein [Bradyrhizobium sp. LHD-71]
MSRSIPAVPAEYIIAANEKAVSDHERFGPGDVLASVTSALSGQLSSQEVLDVAHRMFALVNFLGEGEGQPWLTELNGQDYVLLDDALFQAAAVAPLDETEHVRDLIFDKDTFLPLVLQYAESEGEA